MRILYHHRTQAEDAQGVHIHEMVKAFRDLGHDVDIVALVDSERPGGKKTRGGWWRWVRNLAPNWLYEGMGIAYNLFGYRRLRTSIRTNRPDLLYERYALNTFCGIWASRRFGIPLILEVNAPLCHEQDMLGDLVFKRFARWSERWICSHSTRTVVVSDVLKNILAEEGVPGDRMTVVPNGIDPQRFDPGISGQSVRRKYGLDGKVVIGFVGWFRKWHGLEMLLEIVNEVRLGGQEMRLLLVGEGPAYPDLARYAQDHDLTSSVIFTGPIAVADVPAHIAAMDIAVQPSATEYASPMKVFEYMGMSKCIVAPDQPNIREILDDGVTAFLFKPGDKKALRTALETVIKDPGGREKAGRRAYERVFERRHLWSANAERALAFVSSARSGRDVYMPGKQERLIR